MYKISIIMPVYNAQKYLEQSIQSIRNQTLEDIELICVDDASNDHSWQMLKEHAREDARIRLIHFDERKSALQARRAGVEAACGEYVLFLDADDYYEAAACEQLYRLMKRERVQILHFDSVIENGGAAEDWIRDMKRFVMPYYGKLHGADVFQSCFLLEKYHFNLWNKMFEAAFLKRAFYDLPKGFYPKANDLLAYFVLAYHAKSYRGVHTRGFYHYRFGSGSTGAADLTLEQFQAFCHEADVAAACGQLFCRYRVKGKEQQALERVKDRLLRECLYHWMECMHPSLCAAAFDLLAQAWGIETVIEAAIMRYSHRKTELAEKMAGALCLRHKKKQIATLGIFYHWMAAGGVQRVISLLIPMYLEMGYKVVLFTDEIDRDNEYPVPDQVRRVILPESIRIKDSDYLKRGRAFKKALDKYQVDLMLYHAASSEKLLFDALTVKSLGIPFVVNVHELFSQNMVYRDDSSLKKISIYQIADCLVVLSKAEQMYWSALGIRAVFLNNPVEQVKADPKGGSYILWLGRLDQTQKQYMDAVEIMSYVTAQIPEARLKIVGNQVNKNAAKRIQGRAKALGIGRNVEVCGFTRQVGDYYQNAALFLMTSAYESFPMTLIESRVWHLPLVVYDMPYLELLKDQKGCICVPQGDTKKAADAVVRLLLDAKLRQDLGQEAYEGISRFIEHDLKKDWEHVFQALLGQRDFPKTDQAMPKEEVGMLLKTMVFHYAKGIYAMDESAGGFIRGIRKAERLYVYLRQNGCKAAFALAYKKLFGRMIRQQK